MNIWIEDPNSKTPSVSLTLLVISFTATIVAGALNMSGVVASTSIFTELTYSCVALYFGRRTTFAGKVFSSEPAQTIVDKVDK